VKSPRFLHRKLAYRVGVSLYEKKELPKKRLTLDIICFARRH
jgi:hypothetical protein